METTEETVIPFETTRVPYADKPVGYEEVIQDGVNGKQIITKVDGQVVSNKTTAPKNEVVYFGTKEVEVAEEQPQITETHEETTTVPTTSVLNQSQGRFLETKEISNVNTKVFKKAALEAARLLVFAIPGILITVLTDNPGLGGSLGGTILLVLKSIDRSIHENPNTPVKGLLPF